MTSNDTTMDSMWEVGIRGGVIAHLILILADSRDNAIFKAGQLIANNPSYYGQSIGSPSWTVAGAAQVGGRPDIIDLISLLSKEEKP